MSGDDGKAVRRAPGRSEGREGASLAARGAPAVIPSPCISVCRMDAASGWCEGCLRSLDEIAAWSALDDAAKRIVWRQLPARRQRFEALKRGDPA